MAKQKIIEMAEDLFRRHGFEATSMRDIASAANMQPASMYYHFPSKDEILLGVLEKGGATLEADVCRALSGKTGAWERMEAASIAHVRGVVNWPGAFQLLFIMPPQHYPASIKNQIVAVRDRYESIFADLVAALPLREGADRHYVRLTLIGALSWPLIWYKAERDSPETIAQRIFNTIRYGLE